MTDLSPTGFLQQQQHSQQQQHQSNHHNASGTTTTTTPASSSRHHQRLGHGHLYSSLSLSSTGGGSIGIPGIVGTATAGLAGSSGGSVHHATSSHGSSIRAPPVGSGGGRLFSYFGNDHEHERKKSETSFFNLGFRRKSTVVYYAATD
ncbi:protein deltex-like [Musca vetustissima]|uniref:protein deltex-like n=1 Tax=Musca vetustissima TaxID=27455 RepID=UPI002AB7CEDD|nr:protein deltex-like [Musca vetustissima]